MSSSLKVISLVSCMKALLALISADRNFTPALEAMLTRVYDNSLLKVVIVAVGKAGLSSSSSPRFA